MSTPGATLPAPMKTSRPLLDQGSGSAPRAELGQELRWLQGKTQLLRLRLDSMAPTLLMGSPWTRSCRSAGGVSERD